MPGQFTPTASWPVLFPCDVSTESPTVTGAAVAFATDILWSLTGQRFGLTTVKLRPVRDYPLDTPFPDGWLSWPGTQPPPVGATGSGGYYGFWFSTNSATQSDNATLSQVRLPAPVSVITEVRIDGSVFSPTAYRLDASRFVIRTDGSTWPIRNNLTLDDTNIGTWSITASYGEAVPDTASLAVGELACEYIKGIQGQDCRLPRAVTQLARQGVTLSIPDMATQFEKGLTGLFFTDMFINTWNPRHLRGRARSYSVDRGLPRRNT